MKTRWWLYVQAIFWRILMRLGMFLHTFGFTHPPRPSFARSSPRAGGGCMTLYFYCPPAYFQEASVDAVGDNTDTENGDATLKTDSRFPVVVNFHGGGFTLGHATDDARWAQCVVRDTRAIMVSVEYRLAPEHPFPAAVDDGVDALLYLAAHAAELRLDVSRLALTGFSAGGNLAVTVPLRLRDRIRADGRAQAALSSFELQIICCVSWYPLLDFVVAREHRRAASVMPDKTLPAFFTTLFDDAYMPDLSLRASPFASPGRAPDDMLAESLPPHIFLYTCEWDMLLNEGLHFVRRLEGLGKKVSSMMIEKVPHAWDKSPNPFRDQAKVDMLYRIACAEMRSLFEK
ncbi:hypothetical protein Egran_03150 [Elaphomyces granulatus]|uniref:Alpha/beta hydrolase fold-3 domain-containing protein n=1 Tax=Elaphomyces granulatus TaxID=519963 RepID=A0A232LYC8_9EURO|nr:hypothetical protein Egran_03150 [Elaphomyces granulatus]